MIDELKDLISSGSSATFRNISFAFGLFSQASKQKATIELIRLMAKEMEER